MALILFVLDPTELHLHASASGALFLPVKVILQQSTYVLYLTHLRSAINLDTPPRKIPRSAERRVAPSALYALGLTGSGLC